MSSFSSSSTSSLWQRARECLIKCGQGVQTFEIKENDSHITVYFDAPDGANTNNRNCERMRSIIGETVPKLVNFEWCNVHDKVATNTATTTITDAMTDQEVEDIVFSDDKHVVAPNRVPLLDELFWRLSRTDEARFARLFEVTESRFGCGAFVRIKEPQDTQLGRRLLRARPMSYVPEQLGMTSLCGGPIDTSRAALYGKIGLLRKHVLAMTAATKTQKVTWHERTSWFAAQGGRVDVIAFLIEHACPLSHDCVWMAHHEGKLEALQLLRQHGAPWWSNQGDNNGFIGGATEQHQRCILWAAQNGAPWHTNTSYWAASHGFLDVLRLVHASLQPDYKGTRLSWHPQTLTYAVKNGHMACVEFGHACGYTWGVNALQTYPGACHSANIQKCMAYAAAHGAPPGNTSNYRASSHSSQPCGSCGKKKDEGQCLFTKIKSLE